VLHSEPIEAREQSIKGPLFDDSSELKHVLSGIIVAVQKSHTKLHESVRANQESVKADIGSVKADISRVRNDIKAENEKLIKRFELQSQEAKKEFSAKLDSEAWRLINLVGQVQKGTESELLAVKRQIQVVSTNTWSLLAPTNKQKKKEIRKKEGKVRAVKIPPPYILLLRECKI
jgi:hypothetical protein